jgi:hypothetical protein
MQENTEHFTQESGCRCWITAFASRPRPLFRLICHCKTCQQYTGQAYNDECTFLMRDCPALDFSQVEFKSYQSPLLPIKRGTCKICDKPAYCIVQIGAVVLFVMVPSTWLQAALPDPLAHIYYDRRVADSHDVLPKISGHIHSQTKILAAVLQSWIAHAFRANK